MSQLVPHKQQSFLGGLNRQFDPSKIAEDEYPLLFNGRIREDVVEPIQLPLDLSSSIPSGKKQGIYAVGTYLVAFVAGKAYYRNVADSEISQFTEVSGGLLMSSTEEYIFGEVVPASTINFFRKLKNDADYQEGVNFSDITASSPNAFLVQDGINQPWVIFQDGTSRVTKNWVEWSPSDREYVPIGKFPVYYPGNSITYCAGKDGEGKLNQILHSVSGRPLDFMIPIDTQGGRLRQSNQGDAASVSYRVDFNDLTCIKKINSTDNAFFVSTLNNSYLVIPDLDKQIFGEPTFRREFLFNTGPRNNFSLVEVRGDTLLIDQKGIISFNATQQLKFRGNNSPFSAKINSLFEVRANEYVTQSITCCEKLNNYVYFALNSIYGPCVLVYDENGQKFISIDQWDLGEGVFVKQFAVVNTALENRLFFITSDDRIYEAFASEETATCQVYLGDWSPGSPNGELKCVGVTATFSEVETEGVVSVELFVDKVSCDVVEQNLEINYTPQVPPITRPFGTGVIQQTEVPLSFGFDDTSRSGKHVGAFISWNSKARLQEIEVVVDDSSVVTSPQQQVQDQSA